MKDGRWSIAQEWCGKEEPQYVLRFCGEWVESYPTASAAKDGRKRAMQEWREAL